MFGWDFEVDAWLGFWRWNLIKLCVWTCDMNSTLGTVVPSALFKHQYGPWSVDCSQANQVGNIILCTKPRHQIYNVNFQNLWNFHRSSFFVLLLPSNQAKSSPIPENIRCFQVVTSFVARWHARYLQQVSQGAQTCLATGQPGERGTRDKPVAPEPPVDSD